MRIINLLINHSQGDKDIIAVGAPHQHPLPSPLQAFLCFSSPAPISLWSADTHLSSLSCSGPGTAIPDVSQTRYLGREDPTVSMSTWHFLSASQGRHRCDPVCTDPSRKSRADQQLLQAEVSTPFLPVTHSCCWPINSTDRRDLTTTFTCHLQTHEVLW